MNTVRLSLTDSELRHFRELLDKKRSEAYDKICKLSLEMREDLAGDSPDSIYGQHMADSATSSTEREKIFHIIKHLRNSVDRIDAALKSINEGSYGICRITGKPIERERLEAVPYTDVSIEALAR